VAGGGITTAVAVDGNAAESWVAGSWGSGSGSTGAGRSVVEDANGGIEMAIIASAIVWDGASGGWVEAGGGGAGAYGDIAGGGVSGFGCA
jgi:hypothetical protein